MHMFIVVVVVIIVIVVVVSTSNEGICHIVQQCGSLMYI